MFKISNDLKTSEVALSDNLGLGSYAPYTELYVKDAKLRLDQNTMVSDILTSGTGGNGYVPFWVKDNQITLDIMGDTLYHWTPKSLTQEATATFYNSNIEKSHTEKHNDINIKTITSLSKNKLNTSFETFSEINHDNNYRVQSENFSPNVIDLDIQNNQDDKLIIGSKIILKNSPNFTGNTSFSDEAKAIGLFSSTEEVTIQKKTGLSDGKKSPGIFLGDVGISKIPQKITSSFATTYNLQVNGSVLASNGNFIISKQLITTTINVKPAKTFHVDINKRVGIGTTNPSTSLEVVNKIKTKSTLDYVNRVKANRLNINNKALNANLNNSSKVGILIDDPKAELHIYKQFKQFPTPFSAHLITQKIDQNFTQNSTGIDIDIKSKNQRNLYKNRNAIGLKINNNMTGATTNSKAIGLKIDLPKTNSVSKNYAAIFVTKNVGINTTDPIYPLDINGSIIATDIQNVKLNELNGASFNTLAVTGTPIKNQVVSIITGQNSFANNATITTINFTNTSGQLPLNIVGTLNLPNNQENINNQNTIQEL